MAKTTIGQLEYWVESVSRVILVVIFITLGIVKIAGRSEFEPVAQLIPAFAEASGLFWLGIVELVGGIVLLFRRFYRFAIFLFFLYLCALIFILFREYSSLFTQDIFRFTAVGDKLVRTIGLVAGSLVVLVRGRKD